MPIHNFITTPSPLLSVATGVTLAGVAAGVHYTDTAGLSGAVGSLDFAGTTWLRYNVTASLSGSFTFPPLNVTAIATDELQFILVVEFQQDGTGGRLIPLNTLFANATARIGADAPDLTPGGITQVLIVAQRVAGVTTYTANFPPALDGAQIVRGTIPVARLPVGSAVTAGVLQIGTGPTGAAAGNHIHPHAESKPFVIRQSDGSAITAADYDMVGDVNFAGSIVRLTKLRLFGGSSPTATVIAKVDATTVTGTSTAVISTAASGDADATANSAFVSRQALRVAISAITGAPLELRGIVHLTHTGNPIG